MIFAGTYGARLTAFDFATDGSLSHQRVCASLEGAAPDGICLDADGAVWYADVVARRCVRVREAGETLQMIELDRGCYACALGGTDGHAPFIMAAAGRAHKQATCSWLRHPHLAPDGRKQERRRYDGPPALMFSNGIGIQNEELQQGESLSCRSSAMAN